MLLWIHWTVTERQATGRGFQVPAREGFEGLLSPATEGLISCTPFLGASITLVRVQVVVCHRGRRQEPHQRTQTGTCTVSVCKNACTDNDWINNFEGTRTAIQRVRASPAQDVDGGASACAGCCHPLWTATRRQTGRVTSACAGLPVIVDCNEESEQDCYTSEQCGGCTRGKSCGIAGVD
jgi:hypothetical protein